MLNLSTIILGQIKQQHTAGEKKMSKRVKYNLYGMSLQTRFRWEKYAEVELPVGGVLFGTEITSIEDAPEHLSVEPNGVFYSATRADLQKKEVGLDYEEIDDVQMHIDISDAPDFCDSYVESFTYMGRPATEDEVDTLNEDEDFVYEQIISHLY